MIGCYKFNLYLILKWIRIGNSPIKTRANLPPMMMVSNKMKISYSGENLFCMRENLFCTKGSHWTTQSLLKRLWRLWMNGYPDSNFRIVVERSAVQCT